MKITFTFETVNEYQLALHGIRNFADQVIERNGDNLTITVTELGAAAIENAMGKK